VRIPQNLQQQRKKDLNTENNLSTESTESLLKQYERIERELWTKKIELSALKKKVDVEEENDMMDEDTLTNWADLLDEYDYVLSTCRELEGKLSGLDKKFRVKLMQCPVFRDLVEFQQTGKQNKGRWHVIREGDKLFR